MKYKELILFEESNYSTWHDWYYKSYTKTEHWKTLNENAQQFYNNRCALCNNPGQVIHHSNYHNIGNEQLGRDIVLLCNRCHNLFHKEIKPKSDLPGFILETPETIKIEYDLKKSLERKQKTFPKLYT